MIPIKITSPVPAPSSPEDPSTPFVSNNTAELTFNEDGTEVVFIAPLTRRLSSLSVPGSIPDIDGLQKHRKHKSSLSVNSDSEGPKSPSLLLSIEDEAKSPRSIRSNPSPRDHLSPINLTPGTDLKLKKKSNASKFIPSSSLSEIIKSPDNKSLESKLQESKLQESRSQDSLSAIITPETKSPDFLTLSAKFSEPAVIEEDLTLQTRSRKTKRFKGTVDFSMPPLYIEKNAPIIPLVVRVSRQVSMDDGSSSYKLAVLDSILKPTSLHNPWEDRMRRRILDYETIKAESIAAMKTGDTLKKFSDRFVPQERYFRLNDNEELIWGGSSSHASRKEVLGEVEYMVYGAESVRFSKYDILNGKPWLCFSLYLPHRTIDLECRDDKQLTTWFMGLQAVTPCSQLWMSKGGLLWRRMKMKVQQTAMKMHVSPWRILILARNPVPYLTEKSNSSESKSFISNIFGWGSN